MLYIGIAVFEIIDQRRFVAETADDIL